jgi:hypothetical protein
MRVEQRTLVRALASQSGRAPGVYASHRRYLLTGLLTRLIGTDKTERGTAAISVEERAERGDMPRVVHPHDPFAPCHIFNGITGTDPFPVHHRNDLRAGRVQQDVLRPVVAMHQHRGTATAAQIMNPGQVDRVDAPQQMAARRQDLSGQAVIDQLRPGMPGIKPSRRVVSLWSITGGTGSCPASVDTTAASWAHLRAASGPWYDFVTTIPSRVVWFV